MHVREDDLELYLLGRLTEGNASEVVAHLAGCPTCGQKLDEVRLFVSRFSDLSSRQRDRPSPAEQRKHQRIPTSDPAVIKLKHPALSPLLEARILDVSREGLQV